MTQEQQNIVDNITKQFETINAQANTPGGIIDIENIVGLQDKIIARDEEIKLMQKSYDDAREVQISADLEKLRPQIEALGMTIAARHTGLVIKNKTTDTLYITYDYRQQEKISNQHYTPARWSWLSHTPKIFYNIDYQYAGEGCDTIEDFVTSGRFKEKLGEMYRQDKLKQQ